MTAESSRKTEVGTPLAPGGCPRCGIRLGEPYKYCPNCAYRMRPDLVPATHVAPATPPLSQRLVALGGYLLFASMLLLVVYAGVRLFARPEPADPAQPQVMRTRDPGCLALTLDEFVEVPPGTAFWGLYDPGREDVVGSESEEAAGEERKQAELAAAAIAELGDETAAPEDLVEARANLRDALRSHASEREAIRQWADAFDIAVPQDPVLGTPDTYQVEEPFRMSRREVTNDQYFEFLRAWARKAGRQVPSYLLPTAWKRRTGSRGVPKMYDDREGDLPVVGIPFDAALEFCGWFWEERLGADPDLVVDLPTWKEFVLAARGDRLTNNFPWGRTLYEAEERPNLGTSGLKSVAKNREKEFYNGFLDLVGNAAEWVYWVDDAASAGWSFRDGWVYKVHEGGPGQPARLVTPFSQDGVRPIDWWKAWPHVGFRPVIRRAPQLPSFVAVTAGPIRHRPCPDGLLPPERLDVEEPSEGEGEGRETLERIRAGREPPVSFASETEQVKRGFDISATEITNRQYLAFLAAIASRHTKDDLAAHVPRGWRRDNLSLRFEPRELRPAGEEGEEPEEERRAVARAFYGYYVPWESLETLYAPGEENVPVQGITVKQAEEYARWLSQKLGRRCTLPTAAQYLRAARGDGTAPYPWGDDPSDAELTPSYRPEGEPRAFALAPTPTRPIVGLAGNVAELVRDATGRLLLAGGFCDLPAKLVTLDCFLDASWDTVQFVIEPEDLEEGEEAGPMDPLRPRLSAARTLKYYTGFRVVRLPDPF